MCVYLHKYSSTGGNKPSLQYLPLSLAFFLAEAHSVQLHPGQREHGAHFNFYRKYSVDG